MKRDKDKEKEVQKSESATAQASLAEIEAQKVEAVKKDLGARVALYEAMAGQFEGYYLAPDKERVAIHVRLVVTGAPLDMGQARAAREGDLLTQLEMLSLGVQVEETVPSIKHKIFFCALSGVKPDFFKGVVRVVCPAHSSSGSRIYVLGMDAREGDLSDNQEIENIEKINRAVSDDLLKNKIKSIDAMSVFIPGEIDFRGKIWRRSESIPSKDSDLYFSATP